MTAAPSADQIARVRAHLPALLAWYRGRRRDLPWRAGPPDPWAVLLSEIMLQQTTAPVVAARFPDMLARFPTPQAMAEAGEDSVLAAWSGLGYYRRARALFACARAILERHGGRVPDDPQALAALPGVGPYTAAAVAAIAFGRPLVPVDGNVARVLVRLFALGGEPARPSPRLRELAARVARAEDAGDLAQAWIELGALVCRPRRPLCRDCPLEQVCLARARGLEDRLPAPAPRPERRLVRASAFLALADGDLVLLRRRPRGGLLGGLVDLPGVPLAPDAGPEPPPLAVDWRPVPGEVRHVFTHLEMRLRLERAVVDGPETARPAPELPAAGLFWWPIAELAALPLASLTRRLLAHGGLVPPPSGRQASAR